MARILNTKQPAECSEKYASWQIEGFKKISLLTYLREQRYLRSYLEKLSAAGIHSLADLVTKTSHQVFGQVPASPSIQRRMLDLVDKGVIDFRTF